MPSFGLSNSLIVYSIISLIIFILLAIASYRELTKDGIISSLFFIIPLFVYGLICAISPFARQGGLTSIESIALPIGLLTFACSGYLIGINKSFDISNAFIAIYSGLAVVVLISYLYTMIQFCPFYTIIHKNHYIYYDGGISSTSIGNTAYFLIGFNMPGVSIDYVSFFSSVLSSSVVALFFISPKKEKKKFILYAIYSAIGIISLITTPTKMTILTDMVLIITIVFIVLIGKNRIKTKVFKYIFYSLCALFVVGFLLVFINAQSLISSFDSFRSVISKNVLLNRIFNTNFIANRFNEVLKYSFASNTIIGFYPIGTDVESSHSFLIDSIITSGLIGLTILFVIVIFTISNIKQYYSKSSDSVLNKSLVVAFITTTFLYSVMAYDMQPYNHFDNLVPLYSNGLFFVMIFLIGYTYKINQEKKVEKELETQNTQEGSKNYEI